MIGEPLKAAVEAQAIAAQTSIDFIEKVGFIPASDESMLHADPAADANAGDVRNVTFKYKKKDENGELKDFELTVPILSIVPIPYLRIDEMTIDFSAKITDMVNQTVKTNFSLNSSVSGSYRSWWSPVRASFRTSMGFKRDSTRTSSYKSEYTMDIHVRAVQEGMPAGLEKMLEILESAITEDQQAASP